MRSGFLCSPNPRRVLQAAATLVFVSRAMLLRKMTARIPDFEWYTRLSQTRGVSPRCPFANVHRCPRYFASLWLMGEHGGATRMDADLEKELSERWNKSELSPVVQEQEPSAFGSGTKWSFSKLCPEVAYDRFGWFASGLYVYADEIDFDVAHARLGRHRDHGEEWRWLWSSVTPMHYTECPTYSLLVGQSDQQTNVINSPEGKEMVQLRPTWFGLGIDLKELFSRIRNWWNR